MEKLKALWAKIKAFFAKITPFVSVNTDALQDAAEEKVIAELKRLAKRSDNKVDDRLVEAVSGAIRNGSYMTIIKKFGK